MCAGNKGYIDQFNDPSRHSCNKPSIKTRKKIMANIMGVGLLCAESIVKGRGKIKAISMSNTRKITANRKKRKENGMRADLFGSKPHSNGEDFSRSEEDREERAHAAKNTKGGNRILIIEKIGRAHV